MKISWGQSIFLAMVVFIAIMVQFMVRAYRNQESLVAEDYYARELRFQDQIDKRSNAAQLSAPPAVTLRPGLLGLSFPTELHGKSLRGTLVLLRPNDPHADRSWRLDMNGTDSTWVALGELPAGAYLLSLDWTVDDTGYFFEQHVHLP